LAAEKQAAGALPTVVIVGAGFGGLKAARLLAAEPVRVVLLDKYNYHLFQPLLYQAAAAYLEPEQVAKPVRAILRRQGNLRFRVAEVRGVDFERRHVVTAAESFPYDYLILAIGGQTNFYGLSGVERHGFSLKTLQDAIRIRNHILSCCEQAVLEKDPVRRLGLLTFAVGGGGSAGVEMAGALAELVGQVLVKDYPELERGSLRVLLLEGQAEILPGFPADLCRTARQTLERKGVEVRLGTQIQDFSGQEIRLKGGEKLPAATLIWTGGVSAAPLAKTLKLPLGRQDRIVVEPTLQVPGRPEVYVIGDAAYLEAAGQPLPMVAPAAVQMAECAVRNVLAQVAGQPLEPFRYRSPGLLATIGRNAAVAQIAGLKFRGFLAWAVWLVVHLMRLVGFRNRLMVLINWAYDYLFFDRAVRLITKE
jgi:NADH dehydrogenase